MDKLGDIARTHPQQRGSKVATVSVLNKDFSHTGGQRTDYTGNIVPGYNTHRG